MSITGRQKLMAYLTTFALMLFVGGFAYWDGADSVTIFLKAMFCPIYLLAGHGVSALFPAEQAGSRHWLVELERHVLDGLLLAGFLVVVPGSVPSVPELLQTVGLFLLLYVPTKCIWFWRKSKVA